MAIRGIVEKVVKKDGGFIAYGPKRARKGHGATEAQAVANLMRATRENPVKQRPKQDKNR